MVLSGPLPVGNALPPFNDDSGGKPWCRNATAQRDARAGDQRSTRAVWEPLSGSVPLHARRGRRSLPRAVSVHRSQSSSRRPLQAPGRLAVEQLPRLDRLGVAAALPRPGTGTAIVQRGSRRRAFAAAGVCRGRPRRVRFGPGGGLTPARAFWAAAKVLRGWCAAGLVRSRVLRPRLGQTPDSAVSVTYSARPSRWVAVEAAGWRWGGSLSPASRSRRLRRRPEACRESPRSP